MRHLFFAILICVTKTGFLVYEKCRIAGTLHRSAPTWTKMMKITEDNLSLLRFVY